MGERFQGLAPRYARCQGGFGERLELGEGEEPRGGRVVGELEEIDEQLPPRQLGERLGRLVGERHPVLVGERPKGAHLALREHHGERTRFGARSQIALQRAQHPTRLGDRVGGGVDRYGVGPPRQALGAPQLLGREARNRLRQAQPDLRRVGAALRERPVELQLQGPQLPKTVDHDELRLGLRPPRAGEPKGLAAEVVVVPALPLDRLIRAVDRPKALRLAVSSRQVGPGDAEAFGLGDRAGKQARFAGGGQFARDLL